MQADDLAMFQALEQRVTVAERHILELERVVGELTAAPPASGGADPGATTAPGG